MPRGLYARVQNRGFPSSVADGVTGAGALDSQGHPVDPSHGDRTAFAGRERQTLPQFRPEGPEGPQPAAVLLEGTWGLAGTLEDPNRTPGPVYWRPADVNGNNNGGIGLWPHASPGWQTGWAGSDRNPSDALAEMHNNSVTLHAEDPAGNVAVRRLSRDAIDESQLIWATETHANNPGEAVGLVQLEG